MRCRYPLDAPFKVTQPFSPVPPRHYGFDSIPRTAPVLGATIHATADSVVIARGSGIVMGYDYGNWVELRNTDGVYVFHGHMLHPCPLSPGDSPRIGHPIGQVGRSGLLTGIHVHTQMMTRHLDKSTAFDPIPYIDNRLFEFEGGTPAPITESDDPDMKIIEDAGPKLEAVGKGTLYVGAPGSFEQWPPGKYPNDRAILASIYGPIISLFSSDIPAARESFLLAARPKSATFTGTVTTD